jgi:DNA-binding XRE family transcriptional regulator
VTENQHRTDTDKQAIDDEVVLHLRTLGNVLSPTRLRAARERAVLSQLELAHAAKLSRQTIARLEAGDGGDPYPATIRKLARALGVRPQELMDNTQGDA